MSKSKSKGCFSGIARLLLCKGSLQTHPTDQNTEPNTTPIERDRVNKDSINVEVVVNVTVEETPATGASAAPATATATAPAPPGVVARLMGLDSLPKTNWVFKGDRNAQDLATRSRSVNFMDYIIEFDLATGEDDEQQLRKVRTSVSFREVPSLSSNQQSFNNHDVLVLYLEKDNAEKTGFKLRRKSEVCHEEEVKLKKEEEKSKNEEEEKNDQEDLKSDVDEPVKISSKQFSRFGSLKGAQFSSSGFLFPRNNKKDRVTNSMVIKSPEKPMNQKEAFVESKFMKKIKNKQQAKEVQYSDCSSEESSPISVLDLDEFLQDEMPFSDAKCSSNFDYSSIARSTRLSIDLEPKELNKSDHRKQKSKDSKYYAEVVKKLCKLTEEDIKETKWIVKEHSLEFEEVEDICLEFGQQILDVLVKQVVEELVGFHLKSFIDGKVF